MRCKYRSHIYAYNNFLLDIICSFISSPS
uniref:Uncharacterized protein n=1 Tax=Arundo donax TaxID=35708 RepID=A0A0A8ZEZ1_ARUDO